MSCSSPACIYLPDLINKSPFASLSVLTCYLRLAKQFPTRGRTHLSTSLSLMAPKNAVTDASTKKVMSRGAWTAEEDNKLARCVEVHGAKRWKTVALKSGLNRCGKSCRLRWLNYLRPNIKRGNISYEEEDLIIRLHKLLGNRWSLIAGRLPGRTDNEIKNYWNSHLSKKIINQTRKEKMPDQPSTPLAIMHQKTSADTIQVEEEGSAGNLETGNFDVNEFLDFSTEGSCGSEWVDKSLPLDGIQWLADGEEGALCDVFSLR